MPSDLLERLLIEMTRVTHHTANDVVGVLETVEDLGGDGELGALAQLHALILSLCVDALHPLVVALCVLVLDVLLENDHVRVRDDLLGACGRKHGGGAVVNGAHLEGRSCGQRQHCEG